MRHRRRKSGWVVVLPISSVILVIPLLVGLRPINPEGCFRDLDQSQPTEIRRTKRGTAVRTYTFHERADSLWPRLRAEAALCHGYRFTIDDQWRTATDPDGIQIEVKQGVKPAEEAFTLGNAPPPAFDEATASVTVIVPKMPRHIKALRRVGVYL